MKKTKALDWILFNKKYWTCFMKLYFIVCLLFSNDANAQITVTATSGQLSGNYSDFTTLFNAINNGIHKGDILIEVSSDVYFSSSAILYGSGLNSADYSSILIRPNQNISYPINFICNVNIACMFRLLFVRNFIIDGRINSNNLINYFSFIYNYNNNTPGYVISIDSICYNINIINCCFNFTGVSVSTSAIIVGAYVGTLFGYSPPNRKINILNNKIYGYCSSGIGINSDCDSVIIKGNYVKDANGGIGIYANYGYYYVIDSNIVFQTGTYTPSSPASGINMKLNTFRAKGFITRNKIYNLSGKREVYGLTFGTSFSTTDSFSKACEFYVYNNYINLNSSNGWMFYTGLSSPNTGLVIGSNIGVRCAKVDFQFNTIRVGGFSGYQQAFPYDLNSGTMGNGIDSSSTNVTCTFKNNIITNERTGSGPNCMHITYVSGAARDTSINRSDYNLFYNIGGGWAYFEYLNYYFKDFSLFQKCAYPTEKNSVFKAVPFVCDTTPDIITSGYASGMAPLGVPSANVKYDLNGNLRDPNFPYKGAFEGPAYSVYDIAFDGLVSPMQESIKRLNNAIRFRIRNSGTKPFVFSSSAPLLLYATFTKPDGSQQSLNFSVQSGSIAILDAIELTFPNTLSFNQAGGYSLSIWFTSTQDSDNSNNNSDVYTFFIPYYYSIPFSENFNALNKNNIPILWDTGTFSLGNYGYANSSGLRSSLTTNANIKLNFPNLYFSTDNTALRFHIRLSQSANQQAVLPTNSDSIRLMLSLDSGRTFSLFKRIDASMLKLTNNFQYLSFPLAASYQYKSLQFRLEGFWSATSPAAFMDLDNIRVFHVDSDVVFTNLINPCPIHILSNSAATLRLQILNMGKHDLSKIPLAFKLSGPNLTYSDTDTWYGNGVPVSMWSTATFNSTRTLPILSAGNYTLQVWNRLSSDPDYYNDTAQFIFTVQNIEKGDSAYTAIKLNNAQGVQCDASNTLNWSGSNLTIESWINPAISAKGNILCRDSLNYALQMDSLGLLQFTTTTSVSRQTISSPTFIPGNQWTHVSAVYDGTTMKLYLNGNQVASAAQSGTLKTTTNNPKLYIGQVPNGYIGFAGLLDEVKIYNIAKTATQVRQGMHQRIATASDASLLAYWRMDDTTNTNTWTDASNNCNHLLGSANTQTSNIPLQSTVNSSVITTGSNTYTFGTTGVRMQYVAQNGTNTVVVHRMQGNPCGVPPNVAYVYPGYYWIAYVYGNATCTQLNATFTFPTNTFSSSSPLQNFKLFGRAYASADNWTTLAYSAASIDSANQRVTFTLPANYSAYEQYSIGYQSATTPVTWLSFEGIAQHNDVQLQWETVNEINNKGFYILESNNAEALGALAFVRADDVRAYGNTPPRYTYTHANALSDGHTHYYQLKQIDNDGQYSLSKIITIHPTQLASENPIIVYPNPFNETIIIETNNNEIQLVQLIGMDGRVWMETEIKQKTELNSEEIPEGVYVLRMGEQAIKVLK